MTDAYDALYRALQDQLDAAAADQEQREDRSRALGRAIGYLTGPNTKTRVSSDDLPDWMHQGWQDAFEPWMHNQGRTCGHAPNFFKPQPVYACAWRPGLVVCGQCLNLFNVATLELDRTCDRCCRVVGGPENGDPIYSITLASDGMAFRAGACTDCYEP